MFHSIMTLTLVLDTEQRPHYRNGRHIPLMRTCFKGGCSFYQQISSIINQQATALKLVLKCFGVLGILD